MRLSATESSGFSENVSAGTVTRSFPARMCLLLPGKGRWTFLGVMWKVKLKGFSPTIGVGENSLSICKEMIHFVLAAYHNLISPFLPRACRFFPSCSVYASQAIQKHGILRGLWLGLRRVSRFQPWNPRGYDPVQ